MGKYQGVNPTSNHVKCRPEQFGAVVQAYMKMYGDSVQKAIDKAVKETATLAKKTVKSHANVDKRAVKRKGQYKKSIRTKSRQGATTMESLIYASGHEYSLTHLLENGHKIWNSPGRRTRAFPHWKLGQEEAEKKFHLIALKNIAKIK